MACEDDLSSDLLMLTQDWTASTAVAAAAAILKRTGGSLSGELEDDDNISY
jgi:hypothetical protein